jgi:hypothetical protein
MTTSSDDCAQRPSSSFSGLKAAYGGLVSMPNPKEGAPPVSIAFPLRSMIFAELSSETMPTAWSVPARSRTCGSSDSGIDGACAVSPWKLMSDLPLMNASVFA